MAAKTSETADPRTRVGAARRGFDGQGLDVFHVNRRLMEGHRALIWGHFWWTQGHPRWTWRSSWVDSGSSRVDLRSSRVNSLWIVGDGDGDGDGDVSWRGGEGLTRERQCFRGWDIVRLGGNP